MRSKEKELSICVLMLAYNHEKFVAEAIQGVVEQRGNFSLKLIIGEDCSSDSTRTICEGFRDRFPDQISLLSATANLGIQQNFVRTLQACYESDFIAFCEGDDRWTDPKKLAIQIDFLTRNLDYVAHAHNVTKNNLLSGVQEDFGQKNDKELLFNDLFNSWPFHTVSLVVRTEAIKKIPLECLPYFISADRFINRWIACTGRLYYSGSMTMAVYNRHEFGASQNSNYLALRYQEIEMLNYLEKNIPAEHVECFRFAKRSAIQDIALFSAKNYGVCTHNRFTLLAAHIKYSSGLSRSFFYYVFLILFGSTFFRFREIFRKISANDLVSRRDK